MSATKVEAVKKPVKATPKVRERVPKPPPARAPIARASLVIPRVRGK